MYGACVRRGGHLTCKRVKKIFTYQHSKELITLKYVMLNIFTPYGCFIPLKSVAPAQDVLHNAATYMEWY